MHANKQHIMQIYKKIKRKHIENIEKEKGWEKFN